MMHTDQTFTTASSGSTSDLYTPGPSQTLFNGLRAYYAATKELPLPDRLADLIEQQARRLDEVRCKPE